jgi:hypothetical protein
MLFRSSCPLCIVAGVDADDATFEDNDAEEHAEVFNEHFEKHEDAKKKVEPIPLEAGRPHESLPD